MKTRVTPKAQGHTIMITLVVCLVLGVILLGIIQLSNSEGQMTGRSQNWNAVLPIVEAGIEEAFAQLKHSPSNRAANGWTYDTSVTPPVYTKARNFGDGRYIVTISTNWDPVIVSRAGIRAPLASNYTIFRAVRVQATNQPLFTAAIEGLECVYLTGNGITFNAYDSRDPNYSGPGGVYDPNKVKAGGDVACYGGINSLDLGNADIAGHIKVGPDCTYSMGPNATVGDLTWNQNGIQPGYYEEVDNTDWPEIIAPLVGGTPPRGVGDENGYQYVLTNGIYKVRDVNGEILVKGNAILVVENRLQLKNCVILPNASIQLYMLGQDASLQGVANQSTDALHFMYFGGPYNYSVTMSGNSAFCGVLYAPSAMLNLSGGGSDSIDFSGAIIARCVKVNGKYSFHYDEAVRRFGSKGIIASSWDELPPPTTL